MSWTPAMSVGVPELDEDHKGLIHIINRLAENAGEEARPAVVQQCLVALMRYAESHFGREESVMGVCGFPGLAVHKDEHRDFIAQMRDISRRFENDSEGLVAHVNSELVTFLTRWLSHHIMIEDMAYRPFAEERIDEARRAAQSFRGTEIWRGMV